MKKLDPITLLFASMIWCIYIFFLLFYYNELRYSINSSEIRYNTPLLWICASLNIAVKLLCIYILIKIVCVFRKTLTFKAFLLDLFILIICFLPQIILIFPFDYEWMGNAIFRFIPKI